MGQTVESLGTRCFLRVEGTAHAIHCRRASRGRLPGPRDSATLRLAVSRMRRSAAVIRRSRAAAITCGHPWMMMKNSANAGTNTGWQWMGINVTLLLQLSDPASSVTWLQGGPVCRVDQSEALGCPNEVSAGARGRPKAAIPELMSLLTFCIWACEFRITFNHVRGEQHAMLLGGSVFSSTLGDS